MSRKDDAKKIIDKFKNRNPKYCEAFKLYTRKEVAESALRRIEKPGRIDQGSGSLCGPASLLFVVTRDKPAQYAQFVVDLADRGRAKIGTLEIKAGKDLKLSRPDKNDVKYADWIALASIRDSENDLFDYQDPSDTAAGITMPEDLAQWYKKVGYKTTKNETNLYFNKDFDHALTASKLRKQGYKVALFIHSNMIGSKYKEDSTTPNHWVLLTSEIKVAGKNVSFTVYSWGNPRRKVPQTGNMTKDQMEDNYYGFVAAK